MELITREGNIYLGRPSPEGGCDGCAFDEDSNAALCASVKCVRLGNMELHHFIYIKQEVSDVVSP